MNFLNDNVCGNDKQDLSCKSSNVNESYSFENMPNNTSKSNHQKIFRTTVMERKKNTGINFLVIKKEGGINNNSQNNQNSINIQNGINNYEKINNNKNNNNKNNYFVEVASEGSAPKIFQNEIFKED
jgi:hypothetical protein